MENKKSKVSGIMQKSEFTNSFASFKRGSLVNAEDYVVLDKETWADIEDKIKFMIADLETLNKENKKLESALNKTKADKNEIVSTYNAKIRGMKKDFDQKVKELNEDKKEDDKWEKLVKENERLNKENKVLEKQNKQILSLNDKLERNIEKDRRAWLEYQKLSESQLKETLERLEKERDMIKIKFQSERHLITENVKSELQNENKLSNGKLMLFKKQNEFLETELKYYKKKVKDGEEDRRIMEDKIENYQGQLKIIMDCVNGLEEKFAVNESKLINDSNFEQLKHSINFNI